MSKVVIIGASSGVGRALASKLASEGSDLVLVARSKRDIEYLCADLKLKYNTACFAKSFDIENAESDISELFSSCRDYLGDIDVIMFSVGYVSSNDSPISNWKNINKILMVNYLGVVRALCPFIDYFEKKGRGQIITFSSIAAVVPRKKNTIYSSAKIALETYTKGLRHYLQAKGVIVKVYSLGYVDTSMSYGKELFLPVCSAEKVADHVVSNLDKDFGKIYYPCFWGVVTWVLQRLPWALYKRLSF